MVVHRGRATVKATHRGQAREISRLE